MLLSAPAMYSQVEPQFLHLLSYPTLKLPGSQDSTGEPGLRNEEKGRRGCKGLASLTCYLEFLRAELCEGLTTYALGNRMRSRNFPPPASGTRPLDLVFFGWGEPMLRYGVERNHKFTNSLIGLMVCPVMSGRYKDGGTEIRRDSSWR